MSVEIHLVCGLGGVGKTTVSAAMGLASARAGRRTVVVTIDPARRLADALGVSLSAEPRPVPGTAGALHAMMLDPKTAFDQVIRERATDPEAAERLLANRYYRFLSERLAGSVEYMAVEKLCELAASGRWEVVVVDTPPASDAVDFFRAPRRIVRVFDPDTLWALVRPRSRLARVIGRTGRALLGRVLGEAVVADIGEFFGLVSGLAGSFRERSEAASELLREQGRTWLVVDASAPDRADLERFRIQLDALGPPLAGWIANRVATDPGPAPAREELPGAPPDIDPAGWDQALSGLLAWMESERDTAAAHQAVLADLAHRGPVWDLPQLGARSDAYAALEVLAARLPPSAAGISSRGDAPSV